MVGSSALLCLWWPWHFGISFTTQLFFSLACPSFGVCQMFFHDYIQILHSRPTITWVTLPPSQSITLEACDFHLPLICGVNFDHWSGAVWLLHSYGYLFPFAANKQSVGRCFNTKQIPCSSWKHNLKLASTEDSLLNQLYYDDCSGFYIPKSHRS